MVEGFANVVLSGSVGDKAVLSFSVKGGGGESKGDLAGRCEGGSRPI